MADRTFTNARCVNVVDGDTLDVELVEDAAFGARITHRVRLRLNRINAADSKTDRGRQATELLRMTLVHASDLTVTTLEPYKFGGPKWSPGQWMAEVTLPPTMNLSDRLVEMGLAVYWDGVGPRPADKTLRTPEEALRQAAALVEDFRERQTNRLFAGPTWSASDAWSAAADDLHYALTGEQP